jgi:hypothetical protein
MPEVQELSKSVGDEIEQSVATYWKWSRIFDWSSGILILLAILLSFVAGINAAGKFIPEEYKLCSAVIAGLPALLLSIDRTFKLRARSEWFWNMLIQYQDVQRAIERGEMDLKEASRKISEIEATGNKEFPKVAYPG